MKSCNFKSSLLQLLADGWRYQAYIDIIRGHILYAGIDELVCSHEEADTRLIWHVKHICESIPDRNIISRANDTDVGLLIILLTHAHALPTYMVWLWPEQ